ncbi:MAG: NADPH-dependent FMN reductase [Rhodospirillales bacterium 70-18]|nr:NAD(P)H-dependent oxidoreductase [Rhodospirillales bacterium]OJY67402.1 MAG: NADPH-dependent FMN reductase [Rhodospirillales bacterium 70-18]
MSESDTIKVLGIAGSFRSGSFNAMALNAAVELAPEGMTVETHDFRDIPFYDGDLEAGSGIPAAAELFREKIRAADALLIVTPEYNASIPGILKNAIDWASRPPHQPFDNKPIAIMGASPGALGSIRAQLHLRQILLNVGAQVMVGPQVLIGGAGQRFSAERRLTDEASQQFVRGLMQALAAWTKRLKG